MIFRLALTITSLKPRQRRTSAPAPGSGQPTSTPEPHLAPASSAAPGSPRHRRFPSRAWGGRARVPTSPSAPCAQVCGAGAASPKGPPQGVPEGRLGRPHRSPRCIMRFLCKRKRGPREHAAAAGGRETPVGPPCMSWWAPYGSRPPRPLLPPRRGRAPPSRLRDKPEAPADTPATGPGTGAHAGGGPWADAKEEQQQQAAAQDQQQRAEADARPELLAMDALREVILPYSAAHCWRPGPQALQDRHAAAVARNYILPLGSSCRSCAARLARAQARRAAPAAGRPAAASLPRLPVLAPGAVGPPDCCAPEVLYGAPAR